MIKMRLLALAMAGWAALASGQSTDTNADDSKHGEYHANLVSFGRDVELKAGDSAGQVVVIGASAIIHGTVRDQVVVVGGNLTLDGHVGNQVVVVLGNTHIEEAAEIGAQLVCVGGDNEIAKGARMHGPVVDFGAASGFPKSMRLYWLRDWITECLLKLRPLSFKIGWLWWVASFFVFIYFLIAALFPTPVRACAAQISARPATTLAAGVMAKLAIPLLCLLLPITLVGILVVPFLLVGAALTILVGKAAVLEAIGGKIGGGAGLTAEARPLAAFLIGAMLLGILYVTPVIGFLALFVFSCWALGAGVMAMIAAWRASRPPPPAELPAAPAPPPAFPPGPAGALTPPRALAYPRAGFWERMVAGFLDLVLIALSSSLVGPFATVVAIAYFAGMWAWKGTTVGGMVLNLQVVRQDGQALTFLTAFVRILAALFSACVLFLGFFWIGWDAEKQSWHDKIAGTVVVRLPRAVSLVCC
ncbi:MAG TPA: RDD family protein [Verrucomicrobiae bacterium]|jgi:uncharacterized RDD family membrane protein YckC